MTFTYPDQYLLGLWKRIPKHIKITFFVTLAIGLLIHLFMLTNKFPNHDDITQMIDVLHRPQYGRWFLFFPASFSSTFSMPWVNGFLTILYISISSCLAVSCFQIKRPVLCVLAGVLMVSFPSVCSTFTYMQCADPYFFGMLLACLAAFFAKRFKFGFLVAIPLITLSLAIYQAYLGVVAGLVVGMLIIGILKNQAGIKEILINTLKYAGSLIAGTGIYILVTRIFFGMPVIARSGFNEMGNISISEVPVLVKQAYEGMFDFFFRNSFGFHHPGLRYVFAVVALFVLLLLVMVIIKEKRYLDKVKFALLLLFIAVLPLAVNIIYVMSANSTPNIIMLYSLTIIFVAVLAIVEIATQLQWKKTISRVTITIAYWLVTVVMLFGCYNYSIISNQAYFMMHFVYEQAYSYSSALISNIQRVEKYSPEDKIIFVGVPERAFTIGLSAELEHVRGIYTGLQNAYSFHRFLRYYMGLNQEIQTIDGEQIREMGLDKIVADMPYYPADGSVLRVDDQIIVRFQ